MQRRQETEIDDLKWPQFEKINIRNKVNALGSTLSPRCLTKELTKKWSEEDTKFNFEK